MTVLHDQFGNPLGSFPITGRNGRSLPVAIPDANHDSFGRIRTSSLYTLFDSKQVFDNQPLLWDDAETSGSGTSTSYSRFEAASRISVSATTAGTRVRQTYRYFSYEPGKSQLILMTWSEFDTVSGITKRVGQFMGTDGLYFESKDGTLSVVRRSSVNGNVVNNKVEQSDWNIDPLDGTGPSGITLDPALAQIGVIDYEWLGVGRVRMGLNIDGKIIYCHEFLNANNLSTVYMSTPYLPLRYEISNDGTGPTDDFVHICTSVMSEGGREQSGSARHIHNLSVSNLSSGTNYGLLGIRLQSDKLGAAELVSTAVLSSTTNDQAHWMLILNPTVSGTTNWTNQPNSIVQINKGTSSNTVTGGTQLDGGFLSTVSPANVSVRNFLQIGADISGVSDEVYLTVLLITNNITISTNIEWVET